jgi:peptidoglycan/xylan/chitin deacetylase (PgdA/CDA1 family)
MLIPGVFVISLDFELHWGCFDTMQELNENYFKNTRAAIPEMLKIFAENDIHVTWATVGMLFNKNQSEWMQNKPALIPEFLNPNVSAYEWIRKNGFTTEEDPYHFAPEIIKKIMNTPNQEIGTHTYAHYFCLEEGQSQEHFAADITMAKKMAEAYGIEIQSLVFPRNQFKKEYLAVCIENGIEAVRTSPAIWYWAYSSSAGSFLKRFFRAGDAYLKIQPIKMLYLKDINTKELPLQLPASRLYRPWQPKFRIQNQFKINRILNEMTAAAKKGAYYHIWWHPHNFGNHPQECLNELKIIIAHFKKLQKLYAFESLNMKEVTSRIYHQNQ